MLTKPLGVGVLTTALKRGLLAAEHQAIAPKLMCELNDIGVELGAHEAVRAMTDVTGFGLLGHLLELCQGSGLSAEVVFESVPVLSAARGYAADGCTPGGTSRNFNAYGEHISELTALQKALLCDPQTSGGLLMAVEPSGLADVQRLAAGRGLELQPFGQLFKDEGGPTIRVV